VNLAICEFQPFADEHDAELAQAEKSDDRAGYDEAGLRVAGGV
jgi:hypothetical protein